MLYAALGDSITYGYSATTQESSFVSRIQAALGKNQPCHVYRHAKPGWTSRQLLRSLKKVPDCIWNEAQLVTIMIGGNDLLRASPWLLQGNLAHALKTADRLRDNLTAIVETVSRPQSKIVITTLYNPFPNSMIVEESIDTINKSILLVARRHNLVVADVRKAFQHREADYIEGFRRGQLRDFRIIGNPIHPTDAGHEAIARVVLKAYRRTLAAARVSRQKARAQRAR